MKISFNPTFTHDVPVMTPVDGGHEEETLNTTFNYLDVEAADPFDLKTEKGTDAFLLAVVAKFNNLTNERMESVAYSEELRDRLFKRQYVRQALAAHYFKAVTKVKAGN